MVRRLLCWFAGRIWRQRKTLADMPVSIEIRLFRGE